MKKRLIRTAIICLAALSLFSLTGCSSKAKMASASKTFDETIEEKLNNIVDHYNSEVAQPPSPPYNIKNIESNEDYRYIISQRANSLNYMLNKFANDDEDGVKEYIMATACSEILKEDPDSKSWVSGKEWYKSYSFNELLKKLSDKGVTKEMLTHLFNTGLTEKEIAELSKEEIDRLCAPGTPVDGM